MRIVILRTNSIAPRPAHWTLRQLLTAAVVFAAPFLLLSIRVQLQNLHGAAPTGDALAIRVAVVGCFAGLMTWRCLVWMRNRR